MSSTFILKNKTSAPYRLETKPILDGFKPWTRETYFVKNIVIGPDKIENVVEVNRIENIVEGNSYGLKTVISTKENQILCSVSINVTGTAIYSDIKVKIDNSTGTKTTGWVGGKGTFHTSIGKEHYELTYFWVTQSFSIFENLEVSILKVNHI